MSESTRLGRARGRMLPVALVAAALVAMLALALTPLASAAPSPIAKGSTALTLDNGFVKKAKKAGITVAAIKPGALKGSTATFAVTGGEIEVGSGAGNITHSGGLKIGWGKKSVALKAFEINTTTKVLTATVGGQKLKVAKLGGVSVARLGFGDSVSAKNLKLTGSGASALNQKLTPAPVKVKVKIKKKGKVVIKTRTVKTKPAFKANMVIAKSTTEVEPSTVNVLTQENVVYNADATLLGKLKDVGVEVQTISPTTVAGTTFSSAINGGTVSPLGNGGTVLSAGGIKLVQNLQGGPSTTITLASPGVDLTEKKATFEVTAESNAEVEGKKPLNLGPLNRTSIADLTVTGNTQSPATRSVSVSANAAIQPVAAEVLGGFVKVYQGYYTQVVAMTLQKEVEAKLKPPLSKEEIEAAAKKAAEDKVANDQIKAGESLGSFSFTAIGE
jgi:hypothetical protein